MEGRRIHLVMAVVISSLVLAGTSSTSSATDVVVVGGVPNPTQIGQLSVAIGSMAVDSSDNIYFSAPFGPSYGARLWRADPTGALSVVAGTGVDGFSGDGGLAAAAEVGNITAISVDAADNVYFVDGYRVRRIDAATNIISTVAGTGVAGAAGDGGPATDAQLTDVYDLAADSLGNVYVAEQGRIRKVSASTGTIATIAGSGFAPCANLSGPAAATTFSGVNGLAVDSADNLIVVAYCFNPFGTSDHRLLRISAAGVSSVIGGGGADPDGDGGAAIAALLVNVSDVAVDAADNVLFLESVAVRQVSGAGILSTVASFPGGFQHLGVRSGPSFVVAGYGGIASLSGSTLTPLTAPPGTELEDGSPATSGYLGRLSGLAVDAHGVLYYSTTSTAKVRSIDTSGILGTAIGSGESNPPVFDVPAVDSPFIPRATLHSAVDGDLLAIVNGAVVSVDSGGSLRETIDFQGTDFSPQSLASTPGDRYVLGTEFVYSPVFTATPKVLRVDGAGGTTTTWTAPDSSIFFTDLAAAPDGTLLLAPGTGTTLLRLDPGTGATTPIPFAPGFNQTQIAVDAGGNVFVATGARLSKIDPTGAVTSIDEGRVIDVGVDANGNVYAMSDDAIVKYVGLGVAQSVTANDDDVTLEPGIESDIDVAANDTLTSGGFTNLSVTAGPANGSAVASSDSTISYTPVPGFFGDDSFTYEICAALASHKCDSAVVTITVGGATTIAAWPDFDGDGSADRGVFRPEVGGWYINNQPTAFLGLAGDIPVPADFDGDGTIDRAVYRDGAWYIEGQATRFLGQVGDLPVPGDYDGDGSVEPAVFRGGAWFVEGQATRYLGSAGDVPVPADYDGDGTTEIAVFRPSVGGWYVDGETTVFYGLATDVPVPADYDGDGVTDRAVFRPEFGGWYVDGLATEFIGLSSDVPVPADYDGDGIVERGVFRPEFGGWYVQDKATVFYGLGTDTPLSLPSAVYAAYY